MSNTQDITKNEAFGYRQRVRNASDDSYAIVEHIATDGAEITDELIEAAKKIVKKVEG